VYVSWSLRCETHDVRCGGKDVDECPWLCGASSSATRAELRCDSRKSQFHSRQTPRHKSQGSMSLWSNEIVWSWRVRGCHLPARLDDRENTWSAASALERFRTAPNPSQYSPHEPSSFTSHIISHHFQRVRWRLPTTNDITLVPTTVHTPPQTPPDHPSHATAPLPRRRSCR
jgi:hypothetical protein